MQRVLKPLLRRPLMPLLVVIQVGLACAIACNALFLLQRNLAPLLASPGIAAPDHLFLVSNVVSDSRPWPTARLRAVEARLTMLPGVAFASLAYTLPMDSNRAMTEHVTGEGEDAQAEAAIYEGDDLVRTLGVRLLAGRRFTTLENNLAQDQTGPVIITRALSDKLFPHGHALGRQIAYRDTPGDVHTIIGVIANLTASGLTTNFALDNSILEPGFPVGTDPLASFAVRANPGTNMGALRKRIHEVLEEELGASMTPGVNPDIDTFAAIRDRAMAPHKAAVWLLFSVMLIVLIVALVGIAGITGYWVQQRTHSIGIRRALGARRSDILQEMLVENLLVVGIGVVVGLIATYGINLWMIRHFEVTRLPWIYLLIGAALLVVLGQLAALRPSLTAARITPAAAIRSA